MRTIQDLDTIIYDLIACILREERPEMIDWIFRQYQNPPSPVTDKTTQTVFTWTIKGIKNRMPSVRQMKIL